MSFLISNLTLAQDTNKVTDQRYNDLSHIRWVSQFPDPESNEWERNILERIADFLLGTKPTIILSKPISVYANNPASMWVLDQGINTLVHIQNNVGEIPQLMNYNFNSLVGICSLPNDDVLFTDSKLNKIYRFSLENQELKILNDFLKLNQPTGIAYLEEKNEIWVVETASHQICVLDQTGELIKRIGRRGTGPGEFNYPTFIWINKFGNVFIVDSMNFRVQILNKDGELISFFGQAGDATGYFARPKGIATDSFENVYIVDALFHVVQIFDKYGNYLYAFGKQGKEKGQFWMPTGIYIDDNNFIYVADSYNSRIQIFQLIFGEEYGQKKD